MPRELQDLVLVEALDKPGIHYLRTRLRVLGVANQAMSVEFAPARNDYSSFRTRNVLEMAIQGGADTLALADQKRFQMRRVRTSGTFDLGTDLIVLTFDAEEKRWDWYILDLDLSRFVFIRSATRIGIMWVKNAFDCLCISEKHKERVHCPQELAYFLCHHDNIETLYFLVYVRVQDMKTAPSLQSVHRMMKELQRKFWHTSSSS
jgi:hypothetical protein